MLTKNEVVCLVDFLEDLSHHYGSAGCNDMNLLDTPENRDLVLAAEAWMVNQDKEYPATNIQTYDGKIITTDFVILGYLKAKLKKQYKLR